VDDAGVVTGLVLREARLLFEDSNGVPSPSQLMGSGQSDDPCPSDNDVATHWLMSTRAGPKALDSRGSDNKTHPWRVMCRANRPRHTQANQPGRSLL
jgi:hypothetical protein